MGRARAQQGPASALRLAAKDSSIQQPQARRAKGEDHCDDGLHRVLAAPGLCALPDRPPRQDSEAAAQAVARSRQLHARLSRGYRGRSLGRRGHGDFLRGDEGWIDADAGVQGEVEAKRKNGWKAPTGDVRNAEFQRELEGYVRDQIYSASKKKLTNPVYWFELSIPTMMAEADWRALAAKAEAAIRDAENNMTVDGQPIAPAYVVITNHTFLADEDVTGCPCFGFLHTIKIDDYPFGRPMEIEAALEGYDKHRDISWLMEAWKTASTVPTTFDGSPPELLDSDGKPQRTVKIGDMIEVPDMDGKTVRATVEEISSWGDDKVMLAVGANGRHWLAEMPLTAGEAQAARRYTDAVFGKDNASRGLRDDDPFDLYDWLLKAHANMTQEQVDKFFEQNPTVAHYKGLPLKEARVRVAREYTKWTWMLSQQDKAAKAQQ